MNTKSETNTNEETITISKEIAGDLKIISNNMKNTFGFTPSIDQVISHLISHLIHSFKVPEGPLLNYHPPMFPPGVRSAQQPQSSGNVADIPETFRTVPFGNKK